MWKLKRRDVGNEYAINKQEFLIGRRPTADICITNLHVSRIHALLTLDNEDLYIEDQNTFNGTFVNDKRLPAKVKTRLKPGDVICLGETALMNDHNTYFEVLQDGMENIENIVKFIASTNTDANNEHIEQNNHQQNNNILRKRGDNLPTMVDANLEKNNSTTSINNVHKEVTTCTHKSNVVQCSDDSHCNKPETDSLNSEIGNDKESTNPTDFIDFCLNCDLDNNVIATPSPVSSPKENFDEIQPQNSIKFFDDEIIVVDDDDDEISCSQLMVLDQKKKDVTPVVNFDPYHEIKMEQEQMDMEDSIVLSDDEEEVIDKKDIKTDDYVKIEENLRIIDEGGDNLWNKVPIDLEQEEMDTCDLIDCLESNTPQVKDEDMEDQSNRSDPKPSDSDRELASGTTPSVSKSKNIPETSSNNKIILIDALHKKSKAQPSQKRAKAKTDEPPPKRNRKSSPARPNKATDKKEARKKKLQEIASHTKTTKVFKTVTQSVKVKVSKSRGEFLLDVSLPGPSVSKTVVEKKDQFKIPKVPPAKVKPKEHVEEIRIPKMSFKNLDNNVSERPRLMHSNNRTLHRNNFINENVNLQDVFEKILYWNIKWLNDQNETPPINEEAATQMKNSFISFKDYCDTLTPLIYLEIWGYVCFDFVNENHSAMYTLKTNARVVGRLLYIDCEAYLTKEQEGDIIRENDFCLVEITYKDGVRTVYKTQFCLAHKVRHRMLRQNDLVKPGVLASICPGKPYIQLIMTLVTPYLDNNKILEKLVLKKVSNLSLHFKFLRTLRLLSTSSLKQLILKPDIQDYKSESIPHIIMADMLNTEQRSIVMEATNMCIRNRPGIYLIQGPPGTGKTRLITNIVFQLLLGKHVKRPCLMVLAPSNNAVDNALQKLHQATKRYLNDATSKQIKMVRLGPDASIGKNALGFRLSYITKKHMYKSELKHMPDFNPALSENEREECLRKHLRHNYSYTYKKYEEEILLNANVIFTTLNSSNSGYLAEKVKKRQLQITCCIIDEATQCTELESLMPTQLGIEKFVLVGDHKQLNATVQNKDAVKLGYAKSLFQRIYDNFRDCVDSPIKMLTRQYRMHGEICYYPNKRFYGGKLKTFTEIRHKITPLIKPYVVFSLKDETDELVTNREVYLSVNEVEFVKGLVEVLLKSVKSPLPFTIGIITYYNAQKQKIADAISNISNPNQIHIKVDTVDSFQGQEKEVIIMSCVRDMPNSFLKNPNRLNVALTRAKQGLYIVGNYSLFKHCQIFYDLREDAKRRKLNVDFSKLPTNLQEQLHKAVFRKPL